MCLCMNICFLCLFLVTFLFFFPHTYLFAIPLSYLVFHFYYIYIIFIHFLKSNLFFTLPIFFPLPLIHPPVFPHPIPPSHPLSMWMSLPPPYLTSKHPGVSSLLRVTCIISGWTQTWQSSTVCVLGASYHWYMLPVWWSSVWEILGAQINWDCWLWPQALL